MSSFILLLAYVSSLICQRLILTHIFARMISGSKVWCAYVKKWSQLRLGFLIVLVSVEESYSRWCQGVGVCNNIIERHRHLSPLVKLELGRAAWTTQNRCRKEPQIDGYITTTPLYMIRWFEASRDETLPQNCHMTGALSNGTQLWYSPKQGTAAVVPLRCCWKLLLGIGKPPPYHSLAPHNMLKLTVLLGVVYGSDLLRNW